MFCFSKIPFAIWPHLHEPLFNWKLILGASLKGWLLDHLIKIQTLRGHKQLHSDWDRLGVSSRAAQQLQANPPCTHMLLHWQQQQDPAPQRRSKGDTILYTLA